MDARKALAVALNILAYILRFCAIVLCLLVIILCFSGMVSRLGLVNFIIDLSRALPQVIAGWGVMASPFGGIFRLDFTIVAAVCFLLDFICVRISRSLR